MRLFLVALIIMTTGVAAAGQESTPSGDPRWVAAVEIGAASTYEDDGLLLGRAMSTMVAAGLRVTRRLSVLAMVDRIPYGATPDRLTIDGRMLFFGAELFFQSRPKRVRPFITFGGGVRTHTTSGFSVDPRTGAREPLTVNPVSKGTFTTAAGVDIPVTRRVAIRAGFRLYGVVYARQALIEPFTVLKPMMGVVARW